MAKRSVDIVVQAHDRMSKKFGRMGKSAGTFGGVLKRVGAAAAVYFSGRAIVRLAGASLEAFGRQEQAVVKLSQALETLGVDAAAQVPDLERYAAGIQQMTTMGDEAVLELAQLGASLGRLSGEPLKEATTAAIGFSKAFGMDAKAAMILVAKAAQGNTSALTRYGIQLDEGLSAQEKFNEVLRIGKEGFAIAEAEADTYAGRMAQLQNAIGDVKEDIGEALAPTVKRLAETFKASLPAVRGFALGIIDSLKDAARGAVVAFTFMETYIKQWKNVWLMQFLVAKAVIISFPKDVKHAFTVVVPAYLKWFREHWRDVFKQMYENLKTFGANIATNLKGLWTAITDFFKGEGFSFDWTPLTEGMESALKELPVILKRELTAAERQAHGDIAELGGKMGQAFFGEDMKETIRDRLRALGLADVPGAAPGAGPAAPGAGGEGAPATAARRAAGGLKAVEAMFLHRAPGQDPMARQVALSEKMLALAQKADGQRNEQTEELEAMARVQPRPAML